MQIALTECRPNTGISDVEESLSLKITVVKETISNVSEVQEAVTTIKEPIADMNEYIKSEVEQLMEIQPFVSEHISEEAVTIIQTENDRENNNI